MGTLIESVPSDGPSTQELRGRLKWLALAMVVVFSTLVFRLWQLQVLRGADYLEETLSNVVKERSLVSRRGLILDRNGRKLAANRPSFSLYAKMGSFDEARAALLADRLELTKAEREVVLERVAKARKSKRRGRVLLLDEQDRARVARFSQLRGRFPAVSIRDELHRYYPEGPLAAHVLGYLSQLNGDEIVRLESEGYGDADRIGRYGLEKMWENFLRGKNGVERYVANARGERVEDKQSLDLIRGARLEEPIPGHNVVLTLDSKLQAAAEKAVQAQSAAAIVVIEVETGRILALVSRPSFDPNNMTGGMSREAYQMLATDPRKPFTDKTLRQHYPPGSTFKFITAVAALEDGLIDDQQQILTPSWYRVGGRVFHGKTCDKRTNLLEAIQTSCNTYFWKLAEQVGLDRIAQVAREFGFGAPTGLGLNGDVAGRIPTRLWYEERGPFKVGYTLNASTGQGDVEVTVLQLALSYAAIANGGTLWVPQIVKRIERHNGGVIQEFAPKARRKIKVGEETLDALRRGMYRVVNNPGGTAYSYAKSELIEYAGKTGTAQVRNVRKQPDSVRGWHPHRDHAWFAGFAPYEDPQISIAVLVEHGGSGGKVAGPVARAVVEAYVEMVRRDQEPSDD